VKPTSARKLAFGGEDRSVQVEFNNGLRLPDRSDLAAEITQLADAHGIDLNGVGTMKG
jgi:hypothetical protein